MVEPFTPKPFGALDREPLAKGPVPAQMKPIPGVAEAMRVTDEGLTENTKRMMREFTTGATRNLDEDKHDYEGFLSPYVLRRFAAYMHEHRKTPGGLRDSDNWQKGIPTDAYMKSMWRHFMDAWEIHRTGKPTTGDDPAGRFIDLDEALMALLFNVMGYAHEILKEK
jgi:hypothetical protein